MTETALMRSIHATLGSRADVRLWRVNVGTAVPIGLCCARCRARGPVRYGLPGMADLMGVIAPTGRLLSIETKSATGRLTDEQKAWDAMVRKMGGVSVAPCRSLEEAMEALR